jgi:hypothetical protein
LEPREIRERWRGFEEARHEHDAPVWRRPAVLLPLAAGLLAAAIGLGVWGLGLQRDLAAVKGPQGSVLPVELSPTSKVSRGPDEGELRVPPGARSLSITLDHVPGETYPAYRVDCREASGRIVARDLEVVPSQEGSFTLVVPVSRLTPGRYRIELLGLRGGRKTLLADYRLRIAR